MIDKDRVLEFIKSSGSKGVQNADIAAHIGGKLDSPKQVLQELVGSGEVVKRNDVIYWTFIHKDFV